jgi:hypothetical protein
MYDLRGCGTQSVICGYGCAEESEWSVKTLNCKYVVVPQVVGSGKEFL